MQFYILDSENIVPETLMSVVTAIFIWIDTRSILSIKIFLELISN
jgi:hypothetical protein